MSVLDIELLHEGSIVGNTMLSDELVPRIRRSRYLTLKGGMMVVYGDACTITLSSQLSDDEAARAIQEMLVHRSVLRSQLGGVYIWKIPT